MSATTEPCLRLVSISKSYSGTRAVDRVSLEIRPGLIHALVGENGAGKSTLVRVIGGAVRPDEGHIELRGEFVEFGSERDSIASGIAVVHQEPASLPELSVAENVCLGRLPRRPSTRTVDWKAAHDIARSLLEELGHSIDTRSPMRGLSIADQQLVEIARALHSSAEIIVLDEPTTALSLPEVQRLSGVMRSMRSRGVAIVLITHRLDEVFDLADEVTVLRDGKTVAHANTADFTHSSLIRAMVGRDLSTLYPKSEAEVGPVVLSLREVGDGDRFQNVTVDVRKGEVVGIAGLVGSGRTEVLECIAGLRPLKYGSIELSGAAITVRHPAEAISAGIASVPEDRRQQGLVLNWLATQNMSLPSLNKVGLRGFVSGRREMSFGTSLASQVQLQSSRAQEPVENLSGGNQQKVVIAKWLGVEPSVLLLDEPTRGIDVGTKASIYQIIADLAVQGMAVLVVSSELPELMGVCDRILVLHEGRVTSEIGRSEFSEEAILTAALGVAA